MTQEEVPGGFAGWRSTASLGCLFFFFFFLAIRNVLVISGPYLMGYASSVPN
jgi:hypothetical protein